MEPEEIDLKLKEIIENAYQIFGKYTIGSTLDLCIPHCVSPEEEKELIKTPLKNISRNLMERAYYASARTESERELWEMKHFLPRVLELVTHFEFPSHSPEVIFTRLDLDQPEKWEDGEIKLLREFSLVYFKKCLTTYPIPDPTHPPLTEEISSILLMFGLAHFNLKLILLEWPKMKTLESLLHLKDLILEGINYDIQKPNQLKNSFSTREMDHIVFEWLNEKSTKERFKASLENALLNKNQLTEDDRTKLSWTYEFFEKH